MEFMEFIKAILFMSIIECLIRPESLLYLCYWKKYETSMANCAKISSLKLLFWSAGWVAGWIPVEI